MFFSQTGWEDCCSIITYTNSIASAKRKLKLTVLIQCGCVLYLRHPVSHCSSGSTPFDISASRQSLDQNILMLSEYDNGTFFPAIPLSSARAPCGLQILS